MTSGARTFAVLLLIGACVLCTSSVARADAETDAHLARAAAYWNASPYCPGGVQVIYDPVFVGADVNERAGGCRIWVGDNFQAERPAAKCQTIAHAWGHLLGYDHVTGLPGDAIGVMVSDALPPACAELDAPAGAEAAAARAVAAEWAAYDAATRTIQKRILNRLECRERANKMRRRAGRVKARERCVRRYGTIPRYPSPPRTPRPT